MEETELMSFAQEALVLAITIATPVMLVGLVVGVAISLLQALTQIQEATLTFVPKVLAIFATIFFFLPLMMLKMGDFMDKIATKIIGIS